MLRTTNAERIHFSWTRVAIVLLGGSLPWLGCTGGGNYSKVLGEKEQLVARVRDESRKSESLKADLVEANRRAAEAERMLAKVLEPNRAGVRSAGIDPKRPRSRLTFDGKTLEGDTLDRRAQAPLSPRYANEEAGENESPDARSRSRAPRAYAAAARSQSFLRYDSQADAALYVGSLRFDRDEKLDEPSRRRLMELAAFLKTPDAAPWHVDILGFDQTREDRQRSAGKARAAAVADCLWSHGVSRKRMTTNSEMGGLEDEEGRPMSGGKTKVEIALVPAEAIASSEGSSRPRDEDQGEDWTPVERGRKR